jgi:orotidine-5'-phosphate decarboxylase
MALVNTTQNSIRTSVTPIVALDYSTFEEAIELVTLLGDQCRFYKVGSELFTATGPKIVAELRERGAKVFLDLKFHDIPNTVKKAAASAAKIGASLITVHASGGEAMIRAAVEGAGVECQVLAVTILTSLDGASLAQAWGKPNVAITDEVLRLAGLAERAGAAGVVCSGEEVGRLNAEFGGKLKFLVPGIRLPDSSKDDQSRVVTPGEAAAAGASYIILGRTVTQASDPSEAMGRVLQAIEGH